MIDYIKIIRQIDMFNHVRQKINHPLNKFNLVFDPVIKKGEANSYRTKVDNLLLTIREDTLIIQNSLCKFYHGYNHLNFNYTELNQAITNLENILGISLRDAKVTSFEYGVVLNVQDPELVYSNWGVYKSKSPQAMQNQSKIYGVYYKNSTHKLKCYNKTYEAKRNGFYLEKNIIRVEKSISLSHINSSPRFKKNQVKTLGDICKRKTLELLGEDLIYSLTKIELKNIPEKYSSLSTKELRIWGYMQYEPIRLAMQKLHIEAFKEDRAKYNKIQKDYRQYNQDIFIQEILYKIEKCIDN